MRSFQSLGNKVGMTLKLTGDTDENNPIIHREALTS